jgi:purine-binding chemotaxis protein CheW
MSKQTEQASLENEQYLTFTLSNEMYAIPLLGVKEIIEYGGVTPIPTMPGFIRGVINLRGRVVPVVDLASRFGGQPVELTRRTCIVIVEVGSENETQDMGVVVDSVSAVIDIPGADIEPPPAFGAKIRVDFINGMWKAQGRFVVILNIGKVLSVDEITQLAGLAQNADA